MENLNLLDVLEHASTAINLPLNRLEVANSYKQSLCGIIFVFVVINIGNALGVRFKV
jgi:hypothetical protein